MRKWVFKEMRKNTERPFVWSTFESSDTWESITERYYISEPTIELLKNIFVRRFEKRKGRLGIWLRWRRMQRLNDILLYL